MITQDGEIHNSTILLLIVALLGCVAFGAWGCPTYCVWQQRLSGEAELAKATQNRQIKIQEAQAQKESATLLAEAEVERAKGAAKSADIIRATLTDSYLRYLWIQSINVDGNKEVIYIPTEAGLPLMKPVK